MLHVLFLLLKILGILLLLLIGLFLLILLMPIRYSFELEKEEQAEPKFSVRITWLFWLFYFKTSYIEKVFDYRVRILGHQIAGNQKEFIKKQEERQKKKAEKEKAKEEREKRKKERSKKKQEENKEKQPETAGNLPIAVTEKKRSVSNVSKKEAEEDILSESQKQSSDTASDPETGNEVPKEQSPNVSKQEAKNSQDRQEKTKASFFKKVENRFKKTGSRIKSLQEAKANLDKLPWREWLELGKDIFFRFLKHILPGKMEGNITFGLDDPRYTGYITAIAATFYSKYGEHFSLYPNFERKVFEGKCRGRGRIRPGYMLVLVVSILKDKSVRTMIKNIILG